MNVSPNEAEEALESIQTTMQKTRHSTTSGGAYLFLILTGAIWLVGFLANQFLTGPIVATIWIGVSVPGTILSFILGNRMSKRVRGPSTTASGRRIGIFWVLLIFYAIAAIAVARPTDGRQLTMLIILFVMVGQLAMGLPFSFAPTWWAVPITALALAGYFLLPDYFYLWMAILVGGGMIGLAFHIRSRW